MDLKPGDVVILKSGGHPLSVVEVNDDKVACVWMGNEGDLFRETLPLAVLELAEPMTKMKTTTKKMMTRRRPKTTKRPSPARCVREVRRRPASMARRRRLPELDPMRGI